MTTGLWPHQVAGVEFARESVRRYGGCLICHGVGTGKTYLSLGVAELRQGKLDRPINVLVVAPNNVLDVWRAAATDYLPHSSMVWTRRDSEGRLAEMADEIEDVLDNSPLSDIRIIAINYEAISANGKFALEMSRIDWDMVVFDECHRLRNRTTKAAARAKGIAAKCDVRLGLSGTVNVNGPMDLWSQLDAIAPAALPKVAVSTFAEWLEGTERRLKVSREYSSYGNDSGVFFSFSDYFNRYSTGRHINCFHRTEAIHGELADPVERTNWEGRLYRLYKVLPRPECDCLSRDGGIPHMSPGRCREKWWRNHLAGAMHFIPSDAVFPDMPDFTLTELKYETSAEVAALYHQMKRERWIALEGGGKSRTAWGLSMPGHLQRIGCGIISTDDGGLAKTDATFDRRGKMLEEWMEDTAGERKLVVFAHHHACLDKIHEVAAKFGGSAELSGRRKQLDDWRRIDGPRVLAAQVGAGSVGISLTEARACMFYCHSWSAEFKPQAIGRLRRPGQQFPVAVSEMVALVDGEPMSMDEVMIDRVARKNTAAVEWMGGSDWTGEQQGMEFGA